MKVYIVEDSSEWVEPTANYGVFLYRKDAVDMCIASNLNPDHSIKEHEVIE